MAKKQKNIASAPPMTQSLPNQAMSVGTVPASSMPKKGKKKKMQMTQEQMMAQSLSPEQMTQLQLEEAIKESQNPAMRLKKLKNPLSIKSCLLNLLLFVFLTLILVFILAAYLPSIRVDNWNLGVLFHNMFEEFGIFRFFRMIGDWFASWGKGAEEVFSRFVITR